MRSPVSPHSALSDSRAVESGSQLHAGRSALLLVQRELLPGTQAKAGVSVGKPHNKAGGSSTSVLGLQSKL